VRENSAPLAPVKHGATRGAECRGRAVGFGQIGRGGLLFWLTQRHRGTEDYSERYGTSIVSPSYAATASG
jgi:hypothetical protein